MQAHEISIHVIMMVLQGLCFQRNDSVMKYINMIYQLIVTEALSLGTNYWLIQQFCQSLSLIFAYGERLEDMVLS